jgi:methylated-DNA-[protein]-cysteine S-methyltransferase
VSWKDPNTKREIVYTLLQCVPPGYTITYSALAKLAGTSHRAVGAYMRSNRNLIVIPCHRVVAKHGLGGYSRGVEFKRKLLELEGALKNERLVRVIKNEEEFWDIVEAHGAICCILEDP